jgi:hypothetical protein
MLQHESSIIMKLVTWVGRFHPVGLPQWVLAWPTSMAIFLVLEGDVLEVAIRTISAKPEVVLSTHLRGLIM